MHLMLGLGFLFGGLRRTEQYYNVTVGQTLSILLLLSMTGLILPTVAKLLTRVQDSGIIPISRAISVIFLLVYVCYLYFALFTHAKLYSEPSQKVPKKSMNVKRGETTMRLAELSWPANIGSPVVPHREPENLESDEGYESNRPRLPLKLVALLLVVFTTLLGFNTAFATDSLDGLVEATGLSRTFIGIVLLPLLSNDITVIKPAIKDQMDLCILLTVGKCIQTTLLVIPFTVLLGWIIGVDLELSFDGFEVAALFASTLYINSMIEKGKSHWYASSDGLPISQLTVVLGSKAFSCWDCSSSSVLRATTYPISRISRNSSLTKVYMATVTVSSRGQL